MINFLNTKEVKQKKKDTYKSKYLALPVYAARFTGTFINIL